MSVARNGQHSQMRKMRGLQMQEYMMIACLPSDLPHTFICRVNDKETIFLVAGSDVVGIFNFTDVNFGIESKWIPIVEDTNYIRRRGIVSADDAYFLPQHRNSLHHFVFVHN